MNEETSDLAPAKEDATPSEVVAQTTPEPESPAERPAPTVSVGMVPHRRFPVWLVMAIVGVVVIVGLISYFGFYKMPAKKAPARATGTPVPSASATPQPQAQIPERLLEASGNVSGVADGYLATPAQVGSSFWTPNADAASAYLPVLFYSKPVSGVAQVFEYNVSTGKESQISTETGGGTNTPVFSSMSQTLAYLHYTQPGTDNSTCELVIDNLASSKVMRLTPQGQVCNRPIAWSPDGSLLAYTATDNALSSPTWDLSKLYVYNPSNGVSTMLPAPAGTNDIKGFDDVVWNNNSTLEATFAQHVTNGGTYTSQQTYAINVSTKAMTIYNDIPTDNLAGIQTDGDHRYAIADSPSPQIEVAASDTPTQFTNVSGTTGASSFLLRYDGSSRLSTIIFVTGQAGQANSFRINSVPVAGGSAQSLFSPSSYGAVLLGWGDNYDTMLYMTTSSGESQIHQLNLNDNSDTALMGGLSLVQ